MLVKQTISEVGPLTESAKNLLDKFPVFLKEETELSEFVPEFQGLSDDEAINVINSIPDLKSQISGLSSKVDTLNTEVVNYKTTLAKAKKSLSDLEQQLAAEKAKSNKLAEQLKSATNPRSQVVSLQKAILEMFAQNGQNLDSINTAPYTQVEVAVSNNTSGGNKKIYTIVAYISADGKVVWQKPEILTKASAHR